MSTLVSVVAANTLAAAILALLAWTAGRVVRRQALVHGLWLLALVKLVTPPVLPVPVLPRWSGQRTAAGPVAVPMPPPAGEAWSMPPAASVPDPGGSPREVDRAAAARTTTALEGWAHATIVTPRRVGGTTLVAGETDALPVTASPGTEWTDRAAAAAAALIALGTILVAAVTAGRFRRFRRLLASATPAPAPIGARADEIAARLELRTAPPVLLVPAPVPPMLWPSGRGPLLLLPTRLVRGLTADELDALLAHELAHVRRRDHWVRFVEIAATALFWWYPVAWWARASLRRAEERCCDEWVLRVLPSSASAYASGLLKSLELVSAEADPLPVGASGAGPVQDLEVRLKEILMTRPLPRLAAPVRLGLAAAAVAGLAVFPTHADSSSVASATAPDAATVAPGTPAAGADAAAPAVARNAPARAARPADAAPAIAPSGVVGPLATPAADLSPSAGQPAIAGGVPRGVAGGVVGGIPGGVVGGVPGGVHGSADVALATDERDDTALEAERRALHEQRRRLREQEIELERRMLDLEARAEQKQNAEDAARLRSQNRAAEADRLERKARLDGRRVDLQKQQLQLELENAQLEARMEQAAREIENGAEAGAAAELDRNRHALEERQLALEVEMEKAHQEMQTLEAESRVEELRQSTGELERSLAEHIESLRGALPEAGEEKAEMEKEILRLQSALDALAAPPTGTRMRRSPGPERMKTRQPQPAPRAQTPQPPQP